MEFQILLGADNAVGYGYCNLEYWNTMATLCQRLNSIIYKIRVLDKNTIHTVKDSIMNS